MRDQRWYDPKTRPPSSHKKISLNEDIDINEKGKRDKFGKKL